MKVAAIPRTAAVPREAASFDELRTSTRVVAETDNANIGMDWNTQVIQPRVFNALQGNGLF